MLNDSQVEYVNDFLAGSGLLGEMLLKRKDCFSFSRSEVFPSAARNLDFRWALPEDEIYNGGMSLFQDEIKKGLKREGDFCLIRECDAKRHDPCMKDEKCPMVYSGEDIYYILDETCSDSVIRETIQKKAYWFSLICLFQGVESPLRRGDDVTYARIESFMTNLAGFALGVFDDEGICYVPCTSAYSGKADPIDAG